MQRKHHSVTGRLLQCYGIINWRAKNGEKYWKGFYPGSPNIKKLLPYRYDNCLITGYTYYVMQLWR